MLSIPMIMLVNILSLFFITASVFAQPELTVSPVYVAKRGIMESDELIIPDFPEGAGRLLAIDASLPERLQQALDSVFGLFPDSIKRGISAAVVAPGLGLWTGSTGVSHGTVPMTGDLRFGCASITKTFTAAMILQLVDEGKVSLDDTISRWLPNYTYVDNSITIRQLLDHSSGIYDYWNSDTNSLLLISAELQPSTFWSPDEVLGYIGEPIFARGKSYSYSNTNFLLAGLIVEKVTGNPFGEELRHRFFRPLGLTNTFVGWEDTITGTYVHNWIRMRTAWDAPVRDYGDSARTAIMSQGHAAAGIITTPTDLTKWVKALFEGNTVLTQASRTKMRSLKTWPDGRRYGLGVSPAYYGSRAFYGHTGALPGLKSLMFNYVKDSITVALYLNTSRYEDSDPNGFQFCFAFLDEIYKPASYVNGIIPTGIGATAYPNPTSGRTCISYYLPEQCAVHLAIFNSLGETVEVLVNEVQYPGEHRATFDAKNLPMGAYTFKLTTPDGIITGKVVVLK